MKGQAMDFVMYTVSDVGAAAEFYRETLGLAQEMLDEDMGWAEFAIPPTTLALGEDNPSMPFVPGGGGAGIALAVDDVETAVEAIANTGCEVHMDAFETGVCTMATVADPDGNPIMLHRRDDGTAGRRDPLPE